MTLQGMWAMWAVFAAMVRSRGLEEAYGWLYVSVRLTVRYNHALARGAESGLDLKVLE